MSLEDELSNYHRIGKAAAQFDLMLIPQFENFVNKYKSELCRKYCRGSEEQFRSQYLAWQEIMKNRK